MSEKGFLQDVRHNLWDMQIAGMIFQTRSSADVCGENRLQMSGMNFGYVTENGVNNNVMIKICY